MFNGIAHQLVRQQFSNFRRLSGGATRASGGRAGDVAHSPVRAERATGQGTETLHLDVQISPLADADAGLLGVTLSFHDVTGSRRLREELQQANRQLETAYEELPSTNDELHVINDELGQHFLNLDIGLPAQQLRPIIRRTLAGDGGRHEMVLSAVNRRGRPIRFWCA